MSIFSRIFRKREKQKNPDGSKTVIVRDRFGNVRKIKHRDAAGYKQKQFFNRDGQLTKRKAKGPGMRRYKAKRRNFQIHINTFYVSFLLPYISSFLPFCYVQL